MARHVHPPDQIVPDQIVRSDLSAPYGEPWMPATPEVSVIIPTRNCLGWLPRAIASIGSDPDVEIIVFDDGSTDGTAEWLDAAAREDPRIVVLQGNGIGPARARNRALEAVQAPLVAFLDADDTWYPGKLAAQRAVHRRWPETAFSFTDYRHVTLDGLSHGGCFEYWPRFRRKVRGNTQAFSLGGDAVASLYAENVVGTSTVMARTDLLRAEQGMANDLPSSEDWDLWMRLAARGPVMCIPTILADYLMHRPGNKTGQLRARLLAMRLIGVRRRAALRSIPGWAKRSFRSRVLEAEAEIAEAEGRLFQALRRRVGAFLIAPSRHTLGEFLREIRDVCRALPIVVPALLAAGGE